MSAEDDRIDPRFDPAFQRGYSGAAATLPPAPVKRIADSPRTRRRRNIGSLTPNRLPAA